VITVRPSARVSPPAGVLRAILGGIGGDRYLFTTLDHSLANAAIEAVPINDVRRRNLKRPIHNLALRVLRVEMIQPCGFSAEPLSTFQPA
jgi:hypothetical protein